MNPVDRLIAIIVTLLVAALAGAGIGAYITHRIENHTVTTLKAQYAAEKAKAEADLAKAQKLAADKAHEVETLTRQKQQQVQVRTQTIVKEIPKYVYRNTKTPENHVAGCNDVLSRGAVSLLNSQAANRDPDRAALASPAAQAPTDVGLQELSQHDAEIAGQYHQLASQTNALIDLIENYQRQTGQAPVVPAPAATGSMNENRTENP